jgi:hypothetical protein
MIRSRKIAFLPTAALAPLLAGILGFAPRAEAAAALPPQSTPVTATNSRPIKAKATVVRVLDNSIQVRGTANPIESHTFSYSHAIRGKMQKLFNQGGYQYGDQVEIWCERGADVALKITGKRSKSH